MKPFLGTKVPITQDAWANSVGPLFLEATAGSNARAFSYEEYCDYVNTYGTGGHIYPHYVKQWKEKGNNFHLCSWSLLRLPKQQ